MDRPSPLAPPVQPAIVMPPGVCEICGQPMKGERHHDKRPNHVNRAAIWRNVRAGLVPLATQAVPRALVRGCVLYDAELPRRMAKSFPFARRDDVEDLVLAATGETAAFENKLEVQVAWVGDTLVMIEYVLLRAALAAADVARASGEPFALCWERVGAREGLRNVAPSWWRPVWALQGDRGTAERERQRALARELRRMRRGAGRP